MAERASATRAERCRFYWSFAAFTIATMPTLTASGSASHVSTTAAGMAATLCVYRRRKWILKAAIPVTARSMVRGSGISYSTTYFVLL